MKTSAYKPVWIILGVLAVVSAVVVATRVFQPKEVVPWRTGLQDGMYEARRANKPVLLYFTADWCGPCQVMRRTTWTDQRVAKALEAYVPVKINFDQAGVVADVYGVTAVPSYTVVAPDGETVIKPTTSGGMTAEQFLAWLTSAAPAQPAATTPSTTPATTPSVDDAAGR